MTKNVKAVYEHGVLRPLDPLEGIKENSRVNITVEVEEGGEKSFARFAGIMSADEADKVMALIDDEFERVNPDEW